MRHLPPMPDQGSFPAGTRISTTSGEVAVEEIRAGARLITPQGENVTIRQITHCKVRFPGPSQWGKPILVPAGALGGGVPVRDLVLPPGQLVGVADEAPVDLFGRADVLVPASVLQALPGARVMKGRKRLKLYSLSVGAPALIYAEGTVTETTRPVVSRLISALTGGRLGGRVHDRAGLRVLSATEGARLIARLRKTGDLPDRKPGKRENDLLQWDNDLEDERALAARLNRKAG